MERLKIGEGYMIKHAGRWQIAKFTGTFKTSGKRSMTRYCFVKDSTGREVIIKSLQKIKTIFLGPVESVV